MPHCNLFFSVLQSKCCICFCLHTLQYKIKHSSMIHKKNNQNFSIEQKQLFKIPLEVQRHEGVLWDRLWTCPGSRTQGAAATAAPALRCLRQSRGLWRGRSATYPSSAGLMETLQMPGLQLLAICWHFDLFAHHPSQPWLPNCCFFTSWLVSRVQIPSSPVSPQRPD